MCIRFTHQQMIAAVEQMNVDVPLEDHHDVRTTKQEIAHLLTTTNGLPHVERLQPVARAYLRHANGHHGHQNEILSLDDGADRTVITVVVVHVEEGVCQRTSGEGILILRALTDELGNVGQLGCLDLQVGGILESVVVAYLPQLLGPRGELFIVFILFCCYVLRGTLLDGNESKSCSPQPMTAFRTGTTELPFSRAKARIK